jgi:serine/threonine protein kinase
MTEASVLSGLSNSLENIRTIRRYELLRKLGQGSSGVVFLAKDPYIERDVAIKISRPASNSARKRFFVEAQSAGRLNHANIITIYDAGEYEDFCYLTMEYIKGPTLNKFCREGGLLPVTEVIKIIFKVCLGLDYAHRQGIIHRDIKPSNILLAKNMSPKISDFGIARITEQDTALGIFGTPSYMSPEQLNEQGGGTQADIFALGCVFYELLTGKKAFFGENSFATIYKIMNEEPVSMSTLRPNLPKALETITRKALRKIPSERYQGCLEFAHDLRESLIASRTNKRTSGEGFVEFVQNIPFFKNFSKPQIKELLPAARIFDAPEGKEIVVEGDTDNCFYIILSGRCKVRRDNKEIASLSGGECFGEMALLAGQPRAATVVTKTDCVFIEFSAILLEKLPQLTQLIFYKNFSSTLATRLAGNSAKK